MPDIYTRFVPSPRRKFVNDEPSMTIQSAANDCDIHQMIARHRATGSFHGQMSIPTEKPQFGDFVDVPTYQEAQAILLQAQQHFADLPSHVRDRFGNNPELFLAFLSDDANKAEAIKLGLCAPPPDPVPDPVLEIVESEGKTLLKKRTS